MISRDHALFVRMDYRRGWILAAGLVAPVQVILHPIHL